MRAAIIMEDDDGRRMVYEIIPEQMHLEPEYGDPIRSWMPGPAIRDALAIHIVLEGRLVQGRIWDAPMPEPSAEQLTPGRLAVEGAGQ